LLKKYRRYRFRYI